ncbi:MAG: tetratricopeptide repeat protein [Planctomycetota bacterium]|jgi:tetratricopeptide (TPR) repeat protein
MRILLALLLAVGFVRAEPYVRWVDETGGVRREAVAEVLSESPSEIRLRLKSGRELTLPARGLLELVREAESEQEKELLSARQSAFAGERAEEVRPVLDRLATEGSKPWIREYAAAARAVLASWAGEKDAGGRIERFLKEHPDSRFVSDLYLAKARLDIRLQTVAEKAFDITEQLNEKIDKLGGPCVVRYRVFEDGARHVVGNNLMDYSFFAKVIDGRMTMEMDKARDAISYLLADCMSVRVILAREQSLAAHSLEKGQPPFGAMGRVKKLVPRSSYLLPELRSDIQFMLGDLYEKCGHADEAKAAFEEAFKLAPDARRRKNARERADRAGKKAPPR